MSFIIADMVTGFASFFWSRATKALNKKVRHIGPEMNFHVIQTLLSPPPLKGEGHILTNCVFMNS